MPIFTFSSPLPATAVVLELDLEAQAAYLDFVANDQAVENIERTEEWVNDTVYADLDSDGNVLGIEIVGIDVLDLAHPDGEPSTIRIPLK